MLEILDEPAGRRGRPRARLTVPAPRPSSPPHEDGTSATPHAFLHGDYVLAERRHAARAERMDRRGASPGRATRRHHSHGAAWRSLRGVRLHCGHGRAGLRGRHAQRQVGLLATPATVLSGAYAGARRRRAWRGAACACLGRARAPYPGGRRSGRPRRGLRRRPLPAVARRRRHRDPRRTHYPLVRPVLRALGRGVVVVSRGEQGSRPEVTRSHATPGSQKTTTPVAAITASSRPATRRSPAFKVSSKCLIDRWSTRRRPSAMEVAASEEGRPRPAAGRADHHHACFVLDLHGSAR